MSIGQCARCPEGADSICWLDGEDVALCQGCIDARWCPHCEDWLDKCGHTPMPFAICFDDDDYPEAAE